MMTLVKRRWTVSAAFLVPLVLAGLTAPAATGAAERDSARLGAAGGPESADWVPLKGRVRIGRTWGHAGGHAFPAIDFEIPAGKSAPVFAAGPGTVIAIKTDCPDTTAEGRYGDCNGGQGNLVEVVHPDGGRSRYLHLRFHSVSVVEGEHVCRGCLIGHSGWSGNVSPPGPAGAHLHYEELRRFGPTDPGRMRALQRSGRVTHPRKGLSWRKVGRARHLIRNIGFPPPGAAPTASCQGWAATWIGTPGPDQLLGTEGPDIMVGLGGDDSIRGADGDDRICGGPGDDRLVGGANEDLLDGGEGTDTCFAEEDDGSKSAGPETVLSCERPPYVLSVEVGCCVRFVTSEPAGISCPPDCSEAYLPGTVVKLTLSTGSARWHGCDEESLGQTCLVTMSTDRHVRV